MKWINKARINGMRNQDGYTVVELVWVVVALAGIIGWVINIVKLVGMIGADISAELVIRAVGIFFAPLGAVMGFI